MADAGESIGTNLAHVRERMAIAAKRAGRKPEHVRLIAVSKGQPAASIRAAYMAGQRDFGENYVQELEAKANELRDLDALRWHAIGKLQRNKAREVASIAHLVHAVDRVEIAHELDKRAKAIGRSLDVLVEVNVAGEVAKGGCAPGEVGALLDAIAKATSLAARGLMTIAPAADDPEEVRPVFAKLAELARRHALAEVSMGMSHDFEVAIEEGATIVRVGTAIFGARVAAGR